MLRSALLASEEALCRGRWILLSFANLGITPDITTVCPYLKGQCAIIGPCGPSIDSMIQGWVRLGLSVSGFLDGIFLNASRHLSEHPQQHQRFLFFDLATLYKQTNQQTKKKTNNTHTKNKKKNDSVIA